MPAINKQTPVTRPVQVVTKPGSLLSQAINATSLSDELVKLTLYGQNRVGKTTLACMFPKPLLLISFEPGDTGGANSIRKMQGVSFFQVLHTDQAAKLAEELRTDTQFKTVVLDSATSFQDMYLTEILGLTTLPEQLSFGGVTGDQYRERSEKIKVGLRPFLNLKKNVIVTAKEKDHNPPKEEKVNPRTGKTQPDMRAKFLRGMSIESYVASDLGGSAVSWLQDNCNYIGRLYLAKEVLVTKDSRNVNGKVIETESEEETGRITHRVRTMYHPNFAAGFRSPNPNSVPEYVEGYTPEELYKNLIAVINGSK